MIEHLIRWSIYVAVQMYTRSYRTQKHGFVEPLIQKPMIYAHYHGDEIALIPAFKHQGITTLSSLSRDGRRMAFVLNQLGYHTVDGSSSRRAVSGLIGLKNRIKAKAAPVSFAVDGPKGPLGMIKPGIFWLSQKTGFPVTFTVALGTRKWTIEKAWNKAWIPQPFSTVGIYASRPILIDVHQDPKIMAQQLTPWFQTWRESILSNPYDTTRISRLEAELSSFTRPSTDAQQTLTSV